jgi:hypothetical protein
MRKVRTLSAVLLGVALAAACGSNEDVTETDATETNFFRLACANDAECLPGEVCEFAAGTASADAGAQLGRCVRAR